MERFKQLCRIQDKCVKCMFYCMENNNLIGFEVYFNLWHNITGEMVNNPYNGCGHKLCREILDYALKNCPKFYEMYYD